MFNLPSTTVPLILTVLPIVVTLGSTLTAMVDCCMETVMLVNSSPVSESFPVLGANISSPSYSTVTYEVPTVVMFKATVVFVSPDRGTVTVFPLTVMVTVPSVMTELFPSTVMSTITLSTVSFNIFTVVVVGILSTVNDLSSLVIASTMSLPVNVALTVNVPALTATFTNVNVPSSRKVTSS